MYICLCNSCGLGYIIDDALICPQSWHINIIALPHPSVLIHYYYYYMKQMCLVLKLCSFCNDSVSDVPVLWFLVLAYLMV